MTEITYDNIAVQLLKQVPAFAPLYAEHLSFYDEPLNHVLFGDLVRFTKEMHGLSLLQGTESAPAKALSGILNFIEDASASVDPRVCDLVLASFMENLHQLGDSLGDVTSRFGPNARRLLAMSRDETLE
jgi:hypothetical protein